MLRMEYVAWKLFIDAAELGSLSKVAVGLRHEPAAHQPPNQRSSNRNAEGACFSGPAGASC